MIFRQREGDEPLEEPKAPSEAERAHKKAIRDLAETRSRNSEVRRVADSLRELRERNHFAAQLEALFHGGSR